MIKEIYGRVYDKNEQPLENAMAALLNEKFEIEFSTITDKDGKFELKAEKKTYPFFIAVKEYKEQYLEYWCQNINLQKDLELNPKIDKLEIYGLHCFKIKGAGNSMMVYFRPMSLYKFQADEIDIAPEINSESLTVSINNEFCEILTMSHIDEKVWITDEQKTKDSLHRDSVSSMTSYLLQISTDGVIFKENNKLEISITDKTNSYGEAAIFFSL